VPGDPLEGLTLPPGDPDALRSTVASFSRAADSLDAAGERQRRAVGQVAGSAWKGAGAESARAAAGKVLDAFHNARSVANAACGALSRCAGDWQHASEQWLQARYLADQAVEEEAAVLNTALLGAIQTPQALDYQSPFRPAARQLAQGAIDQFNTASQRVAGILDHLGSKVISSRAFLPVHHTPWYEQPLHWGEDATNAVGGALGTAWNFVSSNPGAMATDGLDLLGLAGSVALIGAGGSGEVGGLALDLTGAGAAIGVPLNIAGLAAITAGVGGAGYFGDQLVKDLGINYTRKVTPDEPGYGATPQPGESTPVATDGTPGNPFNHEVADRVAGWGVNGKSTTFGALDLGNGEVIEVSSGSSGPAQDLPGPPRSGTGYNGNIITHAEAQASAIMRLKNITNATLYIDRDPCLGDGTNGCAQMLNRMVPKGSYLTVYSPGTAQVIVGTGEPLP
jgi:uncharacterized protein YukE